MRSAEATTLWARAFVDELARAGVRDVVVAPGSRSTPLVLAFAADDRFVLRVHLDERSAGFFALGVGKATRRPAAVVTTSGTATANLFPAVIEASTSEVPLLVLTADRPHHLRDSDANQAIDQTHLYGGYARAFFDAAPPSQDGRALRHLRGVAARAVLSATGTPAGPVHVNFPFDKPLEPSGTSAEEVSFAAQQPLAAEGRHGGQPFVTTVAGRPGISPEGLDRLSDMFGTATRPVLVAGPSPEWDVLGEAVVAFARATGMPLLADALSGARFRSHEGVVVVDAYDLFLRDAYVRERLAPDLILRVGGSPTSSALQGWMEHHGGTAHVVVDAGARWKDHGAVATDYVRADAAATLRALSERARALSDGDWGDADWADADWIGAWRAASDAAVAALADEAGGAPHEGLILSRVVQSVPAGSTLMVSNSMPVRDLDAFAASRDEVIHVLVNRGASGIDGIVSTAFGIASVSAGATVCVLGDVAFFHDQNGLLWNREAGAPVVFVLIDNDGGGIFHMLPVRDHEPHFTRYFATPHGLDFTHAAAMHGVSLTDVTQADLGGALTSALRVGRTAILRVSSVRVDAHARRRDVGRAVASRVREALG